MGTQYKISELMDGYIDSEFYTEEQNEDVNAVLNGVMGKLKPKKRLRLGTKIFAAAAVVTVMSLIIGAALPETFYKFADGLKMSVSPGYITYNGDDAETNHDNIYKVEDDSVYFNFDGQHLDITDLIDLDNAYYYRAEDITDNMGGAHERWIVVGGTPERIGWVEIITDTNGLGCDSVHWHGSVEYYQFYIDGETVTFLDMEENMYDEYSHKYPMRSIDFNWVREVKEKFEGFGKEYYDEEELVWSYPFGWTGEQVDNNFPKPENLEDL